MSSHQRCSLTPDSEALAPPSSWALCLANMTPECSDFDDVEIILPYQSSLACPCVPDLGAAEPLLHALHAV